MTGEAHIPQRHYTEIVTAAATGMGDRLGQEWKGGSGAIPPGDDAGNLLAHAYEVDPFLAASAMADLMRAFIERAQERGLPRPTLGQVLDGLPLSVNRARHKTLDLNAMIDRIQVDTPMVYGDHNL